MTEHQKILLRAPLLVTERRGIDPSRIRLDAASACQLRCPCCVQERRSENYSVKDGILPFDRFRKLLDDNPQVSEIELSNWGEIFVNPHLVDILRYAHEKGVRLSAGNGVNLNHARDDMLEALVKYGVTHITCSIDGATNEIYKQYRVRGNLDKVIAHIERINHYKDLYQSTLPRLSWQFVVFGHNQHEIDKARAMATALDMDFKPKLSWDPDYSPPRADDIIEREFGSNVSNVRDYKKEHGEEYMQDTMCNQLWNEPVINSDGTVFGCCANFWKPFEKNAFTDGLHAAINSPNMNYARSMLTGTKGPRPDIPCTTCRQYKTMQETGRFIRPPSVPSEPRLPPMAGEGDRFNNNTNSDYAWWRLVWRHYVNENPEQAREGLKRFSSADRHQLIQLAKQGILATSTNRMLPAIGLFIADLPQITGAVENTKECQVALFLTAFGQAALQRNWRVARIALGKAIVNSTRSGAIHAWSAFCRACAVHFSGGDKSGRINLTED